LKSYEKESFVKIFIIFFGILFLMSGIIAYLYYKEEVSSLNNILLYEMREYNFNFKGKKFDATIVKNIKNNKIDILQTDDKEVFALFRIPREKKNFLKIIYPLKKYENDINKIRYKVFMIFFIVVFFLLLLSVAYALYALAPMKKAISLVENFLKDIIHDINTPITTILLNTKFLKNKYSLNELDRIETSAKNILSLYKNFEMDTKEFHPEFKNTNIYELIKKRVIYFKQLYPHIDIKVEGVENIYKTDENAFVRIIDNLISNACKYASVKNPKINIAIKKKYILIEDNGIGIENISKAFGRFYKEHDNGIGIGLNIVKNFCDTLNIGIEIKSQKNIGTIVKLTLN